MPYQRSFSNTRNSASLRGLAAFKRDAVDLPDQLGSTLQKLRQLDEELHAVENACALEVETYVCQNRPPLSGKRRQATAPDEELHKSKLQKVEEAYQTVLAVAQQKVQLGDELYNIVDAHMKRLSQEYDAVNAEVVARREELAIPLDSNAHREIAALSPTQLTKVKPSLRKRVLKSAHLPQQLPGLAPLEAIVEAEVLYCVCRQPTSGEMIACDNDDCGIGWFHYECVGLTPGQNMEGQTWLCDECRQQGAKPS